MLATAMPHVSQRIKVNTGRRNNRQDNQRLFMPFLNRDFQATEGISSIAPACDGNHPRRPPSSLEYHPPRSEKDFSEMKYPKTTFNLSFQSRNNK
ncbi:hypothetical protein [Comamonas thiooxydans]|uniref:hypothetical protein n=1 Tax=Comamonas thiooxydans TaxID=363952 RepID=UPI0010408CC4|nr:hypothetical protein [Comamonas thiooxydans]